MSFDNAFLGPIVLNFTHAYCAVLGPPWPFVLCWALPARVQVTELFVGACAASGGALEALLADDARAERIAKAGFDMATDYLHPNQITRYWFEVFKAYSSRMAFNATRHKDAVPLVQLIQHPAVSKFDDRTCDVCPRKIHSVKYRPLLGYGSEQLSPCLFPDSQVLLKFL
jgi:Glycosyl transferase family 90